MIAKYRAEKQLYADKTQAELSASELLGDRDYPHCLLVIEGAQELYKMNAAGMLPSDYLDSLILRLNTGTQGEWYRNHFPVILETNMSHYFNETIYNDMQQSEMTFPTIEFQGYSKTERDVKLSKMFNSVQLS